MGNNLMKHQLKKIAIKLIHPFATRLGYRRTLYPIENHFSKNSLLRVFFTNLKAIGFVPKHIIDVGANHGTWTREVLQYFPKANYSLIEPQSWLQPSFQDILDVNPSIKYYPVGVGADEGVFQFTIADRDDSCSFRYTKSEAKAAGFEQVELSVETLNNIVVKSDFPFPDIVKIDAEGLDIEVLKGADALFGKTEIFLVEAAVVNKNLKNSCFEVIKFMETNGYTLFDITELNRPFGNCLWLMELVFVLKKGIVNSYDFKNRQ
jgi:FkbM family methyltransferase